MDRLRKYITLELQRRNENWASAAEKADLGDTYLWELFNKPGTNLGPKGARKLGKWLGVPGCYLLEMQGIEGEPEFTFEELVAMASNDEMIMEIVRAWPGLNETEREIVYTGLGSVYLRREQKQKGLPESGPSRSR